MAPHYFFFSVIFTSFPGTRLSFKNYSSFVCVLLYGYVVYINVYYLVDGTVQCICTMSSHFDLPVLKLILVYFVIHSSAWTLSCDKQTDTIICVLFSFSPCSKVSAVNALLDYD